MLSYLTCSGSWYTISDETLKLNQYGPGRKIAVDTVFLAVNTGSKLEGTEMEEEKRFEIVSEESRSLGTEIVRVIRDKETGVQYLFHKSGYGGGLTVLVGRDGKPIIG